ncbi:MAG: DUF3088 domain-containing protein [Hyphomonadaceae bacterium]|nr:DUF3088 domain-containing protein [Hyphomonadaceae bacterium]
MRDTLFIIKAPFEDAAIEGTWFCTSCAMMEGMMLANPQWARSIDVKRLPFPRPRRDIIALIGEENQSMPVLVIGDIANAPGDAKLHEGRAFLDEPKAIARYLAKTYGGAGPHP